MLREREDERTIAVVQLSGEGNPVGEPDVLAVGFVSLVSTQKRYTNNQELTRTIRLFDRFVLRIVQWHLLTTLLIAILPK
jgi:hypothetical protein